MNQLERIQRGLKCSEAEARAVLESDKAINKGLPQPFDLSADKQKEVKKMTRAETTVYTFKKPREKKKNATKAELIAGIADFLTKSVENLEVLNAERQIKFDKDGNTYELTLTQKRKGK